MVNHKINQVGKHLLDYQVQPINRTTEGKYLLLEDYHDLCKLPDKLSS